MEPKHSFSLALRLISIQTLCDFFSSLTFKKTNKKLHCVESVLHPEIFCLLVTITCTVMIFLAHCCHRLFCTCLFIDVYKCQLVLYLSFILPGFVILINFLLERLYIYFF